MHFNCTESHERDHTAFADTQKWNICAGDSTRDEIITRRIQWQVMHTQIRQVKLHASMDCLLNDFALEMN